MKTELSRRLRSARIAAGFKKSKEFAKKYKINYQTYSLHESGTRNPEAETLEKYAKILDVRLAWLKDGDGLPYSKSSNKKIEISNPYLDIRQVQALANAIIDEELLQIIMAPILNTPDKNQKRSFSSAIKLAVEIYNEVIIGSNDKKARMHMAQTIINAYKKII